jgi:hypothetical protein
MTTWEQDNGGGEARNTAILALEVDTLEKGGDSLVVAHADKWRYLFGRRS